MNPTLSGKIALVTGSSRGIGSAIALELARYGAGVWLHASKTPDKAESVKKQIEDEGGLCYGIITADLTKKSGTADLIKKLGGIDILVLNASVQYKNNWESITDEEYDAQMTCNFYSSLSLIKQAVPYMRVKKYGRIITIGSVQEAKPHPQMLVYSSSKAAQTAMVKSLALQLAKDGITVNNVAPGVICTDRNVDALADPEYAKIVTDSIPLGFYGEKEDVAPIVRLLAGKEGRYITGQSIYVDGGKSL